MKMQTERAVEFRNGVEIPPKVNGAARLKAISAGKFLAMEIPARKMILGPIVPEQGQVMLHGQRGQGKTHLALGIGVAASAGKDFLKWKGTVPYKTLFVDGELPQSVLQGWLAETVMAIGASDAADTFRLITPDLQECGIPDLATLEGQSAMLEHTEWADFIILDNLSSLVRSGKENEGESWLPIQQWGLELRRQGKSIMFVHHSGRNGQARGTSRREDLLDTIIALRAPHTYKPNEGLHAEIHFEKHRHFFGKDADPFEVVMSAEESGVPVWTTSEIEVSTFDKAVKLFDEGCDLSAVKEELGISRATAFRYRNQWKQSQGVSSS